MLITMYIEKSFNLMQSFFVLEFTPQIKTILNKFINNIKNVNNYWFYIYDIHT